MEELFLEFLSKTLNMDKVEVAGLIKTDDGIKEDALKQLLAKDAARVKAKFDQGEQKARKNVLTDFEKEIAEEFGVDSDKKGKELIAAIIEAKTPKGDSKKEVSEDAVKKHPLYVSLESKLTKAVEDKDKEWQGKLTAKEKEWNQEKTFATVKDKALQLFDSLNPILSSDPAKAANQKQILINELQKYGYEIVNDQIVINKPDGSLLEDEHLNKVKFTDFVKKTASTYFDFKVADDRSSPNGKDKTGDNAKQNTFKGTLPKTKSEYATVVMDQKIPVEERAALKALVDSKELVLTD